MKLAALALAGAVFVATAVPSIASAQALDPSTSLYNDLATFRTRLQPTFDAADRWVSATGTGLSAQPGEIQGIESDLLALQDEAASLEQQGQGDGIDAHVARATEATHQQVREFFVAVYLADVFGGSRNEPTSQKTILAHVDRFVALSNVANTEMQLYADNYKREHAVAG